MMILMLCDYDGHGGAHHVDNTGDEDDADACVDVDGDNGFVVVLTAMSLLMNMLLFCCVCMSVSM